MDYWNRLLGPCNSSRAFETMPRPPRRKRYRGTHPRKFEEKYKELDPGRYPSEAAKVLARGQTPAGAHLPVLLREVLRALEPKPGAVFLDSTLGHGGHAEAAWPHLLPGGRLLGLDLDAEELERTRRRLFDKGIELSAHHANFAGLGKVLAAEGLEGVDALLADLGVSSVQLDNPSRGFSFKHDGPLDMRMDRSRGLTAEEWLRTVEEEKLREALSRWGDEPEAARVAAAIKAAYAAEGGPKGTQGLLRAILAAKGLGARYKRKSPFDLHPAQRAFQAIRMAVNREEESLKQLLRILPYVLRPGGRAAILTFHSGEDRLVESAFREGLRDGLYRLAPEEPARPTPEEVRSNPRARSAKLRWVERG
jgi:16S rRNA (cytosine1402-N4)-methyltransferase